MTEDIVDTAIGAIILAIGFVVSIQILFPNFETSILTGLLEIFVKAVIWVVLIAILVAMINDLSGG